ncbi:hypothetical protein T484DRAFT_1775269 [Baffinella frigidus]|nr:hypothetical protein T484DRAFT_1775269 [Cryptophyta sp. CCMP2293]
MGCESSKEEMGSEASNADASAKVPSAADAPRIPETQETQIFLTHDWADDELGRSNHDRVKRVYRGLKDMGISAWFDEEELSGDINQKV